MGHGHPTEFKPVEYYRFGGKGKKIVGSILIGGLIIMALGLMLASGTEYKMVKESEGHGSGHHSEAVTKQMPVTTVDHHEGHSEGKMMAKKEETHAAHGHAAHWWSGHYAGIQSEADLPTMEHRFYGNLLINAFMFTGIALLGIFFIAVHHATNSGWYVQLQRIAESFGYWLIIGPVVLLLVYFAGGDLLYMWKNPEAIIDPEWKHLIEDKASWWLNNNAFVGRHIFIFLLWFGLFWMIRKNSLKEDKLPGKKLWIQRNKMSAVYIILFALSFSAASWDWIMSVEATWFSTMFAVRTFASSWVSALAMITLVAVFLKRAGYFPHLSNSVFHDLGKYMFGFSVFWTYIWFCEFLLIWYANIPEEGFYFFNRLGDYGISFFFVGFLNFVLPFLVLMTNESKRNLNTLVFAALIILFGHWLDFYLMVMPGAMGPFASVGLLELGMFITFLGAFLFMVGTMLSKAPLMPKNHPYLEESLDHNYEI